VHSASPRIGKGMLNFRDSFKRRFRNDYHATPSLRRAAPRRDALTYRRAATATVRLNQQKRRTLARI
jgi:hypothetical protein